jgi:hypothetical protein
VTDENLYWWIRDGLYEPVTDAMTGIVEAERWPSLVEILRTYWPEVTFDLETYSDTRSNRTDVE